MHPVLAIAKKDMAQLFRDRVGFFFVFIFPIGFGVLFGVIFSGASDGPSNVRLVIADLDNSPASEALIGLLEDDPKISVTLDADRDAAFDMVRTGEQAGALLIPEGFGDDLESMFFGEGAELVVSFDPGKNLESGVLRGMIQAAAYQTMFGAFQGGASSQRMLDRARESLAESEDLNFAERAVISTFLSSADSMLSLREQDDSEDGATGDGTGGFQPITITDDSPATGSDDDPDAPKKASPDTAFEITFPQAVAWGLMSCVLGFGLGVVGERTRGTLTRLRLAPIAPWQIIAGKALACFLTCLGVQVLIMSLGVGVFGVRPDSWGILIAGILCACIAFVGLGMLLASLGKTETGSEGLSRAVLLILALVGGAGVPLAIMPGWVQQAASISPFKWVIQVLDGALWRQATFGEVIAPCAVLIGIGVVGFLIGALLFQRSSD